MTTNKDGFAVGKTIDSDDLLTHMAKARQAAKGETVKPSKDAALLIMLQNELSAQRVRLKPLGLEILAQAINKFFTPKAKKAV